MPFSFFEIEEKKTRKIFFLFLTLVFFYFFGFLIMYVAVTFNVLRPSHYRSLNTIFIIMLIAFLTAALHWFFSIRNMIDRILDILDAKPLDKDDIYHNMLKNIVEEASIAAGSRFNIEPYVINSHYLNAFSISDFKKRCVVGITEGLLIKLNRNQLEAVIAHEVSHIVWDDSIISTVSSSLSSVYAVLFRNLSEVKSNKEKGNTVNLNFFPLLIIIGLLHLLTKLLNTWISREKEYRADATAVRLTRNPLALAELLYIIRRGWRGSYIASEEIGPIFMINPKYEALDEKSGFIADLFSTHPPVESRINILLKMAHSDLKLFESSVKERVPQTDILPILTEVAPKIWYINNDNNWQGPFNLADISKLTWFKTDTWVKGSNDEIKPACEYNEFNGIFKGNLQLPAGSFNCPVCHQGLEQVYYEGCTISRCRHCEGYLIKKEYLPRILARREIVFSAEIKKLAKVIRSMSYRIQENKNIYKNIPASILNCSCCGKKMTKNLYSGCYPYCIEVNTCSNCDLIWFDKNDLEIIQYIGELG